MSGIGCSGIGCSGDILSGLTGSAITTIIPTSSANIGWSNSGQSTYYNASDLVNNTNNK